MKEEQTSKSEYANISADSKTTLPVSSSYEFVEGRVDSPYVISSSAVAERPEHTPTRR
jgi:hypothetical protein